MIAGLTVLIMSVFLGGGVICYTKGAGFGLVFEGVGGGGGVWKVRNFIIHLAAPKICQRAFEPPGRREEWLRFPRLEGGRKKRGGGRGAGRPPGGGGGGDFGRAWWSARGNGNP